MSKPSDETSLAETGFQSGPSSAPSGSGQAVSRPGWLSSSASSASGHELTPGALLAERYRILGLAGRGGMGEVYRAEDLRLGQTVALKFLPGDVARDPQRLAQFHNEVRIARQVSHRNVCRVYDIGEDLGRVFLTMEFVDGEDLASLLKRVGRFPEERATEIARQICAGLAAAHEQGVLHRDLKPANIMLDGEGRVRITDFGLAGIAGTINDVRSGTPAYMAPEQLAGLEVSERSDLFSLGLVLFELFTGKRAFTATTLAELLRQQDEGVQLARVSGARDLDPAVERVMMRCLAREPSARPPSAIAVSAALPGGDPLAAALAAGETPSPAMVAAAGHMEAVPVAIGLSLAAFTIACLIGFIALKHATSFHRVVPLPLSPAVLEDRARQVLDRFGYKTPPADTIGELTVDQDYVGWAKKQPEAGRWSALGTGRVPVVEYWYRTSPRPLLTRSESREPSTTDPPFRTVGMTLTTVDTTGHLLDFHAVPPQRTPAPAASAPAAAARPEMDWQVVFDAVGWPRDRFAPVTPEWTPLVATDTRAAWTGTLPALGATPLRLEVGAFAGKVVFVQTVGPWTKPTREEAASANAAPNVSGIFLALLILVLIVGSGLLARRSMVLNRGDRRGALRVATMMVIVLVARWVCFSHHVADYAGEQDALLDAVARALLPAGIIWLAYMGIEPWIRRHWPTSMISWTRLLAGSIRDPLVGRDVLIGLAFGIGSTLVPLISDRALTAMAGGSGAPDLNGVWALTTPRYVIALFLGGVSNSVFNCLLLTLLYVVLRRLMPRPWMAAAVLMIVLGLVMGAEGEAGGHGWAGFVMIALMAFLIVAPLLRFGLLPFAVSFFSRQLLASSALTADLGAWFAMPTWIMGVALLALTVAAFMQSRAGAPTFGRLLEE